MKILRMSYWSFVRRIERSHRINETIIGNSYTIHNPEKKHVYYGRDQQLAIFCKKAETIPISTFTE